MTNLNNTEQYVNNLYYYIPSNKENPSDGDILCQIKIENGEIIFAKNNDSIEYDKYSRDELKKNNINAIYSTLDKFMDEQYGVFVRIFNQLEDNGLSYKIAIKVIETKLKKLEEDRNKLINDSTKVRKF